MTTVQSVALVAAFTFMLNIPFGWWRASVSKFSPTWFIAVHAAVPVIVALRFVLGMPFRWVTLPLFVACYFGGQFFGARLRQRRLRREPQ